VHDEIAAGGMATVHYGRMLGEAGFSRTVAVKRLHDAFAKDPDFIAMFMDEARLAARIHHPNVVTTLDVVEADGVLVLVMEYLHGETLSRLLRFASRDGEKVPLDIASAIVCDALHGLHAAHEATAETGAPLDLVHRDVSPQNLLVGAEGITRVVDFGVAKAVGQVHTTREGQLKGKIAYMAPEQLLGEPVDRRADVYAAGIVLWELLTQAPLFASDSDGGTLRKALAHTPALPSSIDPRVPRALDEVVMTALARDPAARFATARDMAQALEASSAVASARRVAEWVDALAGDRVAARRRRLAEIERMSTLPEPSPAPEPPVPPAPRRWPLVLGALGLVVAALLGARLATSSSTESPASASAPEIAPSGVTTVAPRATGEPPLPSVTEREPAAVPSASASASASLAGAQRAPPRRSDGKATSKPTTSAPCPVHSFVDREGIVQFRRECPK
jgi:eukaryotic-like serine/threonine-protein kinase